MCPCFIYDQYHLCMLLYVVTGSVTLVILMYREFIIDIPITSVHESMILSISIQYPKCTR
jgi:hypothetical protein